MLKAIFSSLLVSCVITVAAYRDAAAQEVTARPVAELLPAQLADVGQTARIRAFDVGPDGNSLAVLYVLWGSSPSRGGAELWVAVWDISSGKFRLTWKDRIAAENLSGAAGIKDAKEVIFTADKSQLLVLALSRVWRLDAKNGGASVLVAGPKNALGQVIQMRLVTDATIAVTYEQDANRSFLTELIDISSRKKIISWTTSAVPQSFSADGKLAITVTRGFGEVNLQVVDTSSGATLRTVPVTVVSTKHRSHESVSALARFLDKNHVVVAPSHVIDRQGKPPAYGLLVIDASDGRLVREITPKYYRPGGDIVVSRNRGEFVVYSLYARERDFRWESLHPKDLKINLFVFRKDSGTPDAEIPNVYVALEGGKGEPLRLSSDGSVLAVSESPSGSIKIFQIKAP
ncbi:MAG: hypothetical protein WCF22_00860 [Candidatus Sulfotelmatobacter sp.]